MWTMWKRSHIALHVDVKRVPIENMISRIETSHHSTSLIWCVYPSIRTLRAIVEILRAYLIEIIVRSSCNVVAGCWSCRCSCCTRLLSLLLFSFKFNDNNFEQFFNTKILCMRPRQNSTDNEWCKPAETLTRSSRQLVDDACVEIALVAIFCRFRCCWSCQGFVVNTRSNHFSYFVLFIFTYWNNIPLTSICIQNLNQPLSLSVSVSLSHVRRSRAIWPPEHGVIYSYANDYYSKNVNW